MPHSYGEVVRIAEPRTDAIGEFPAVHAHLLVLGLELYGGDLPTPEPSPSESAGPTIGIAAPSADRSLADLGQDDLTALVLLQAPIHSSPFRPALSPTLSPRCSLCDRARGERSGVRLI